MRPDPAPHRSLPYDPVQRRMLAGILLSLLVHGAILSLRFGVPGLDLPGRVAAPVTVRLAPPPPQADAPLPPPAVVNTPLPTPAAAPAGMQVLAPARRVSVPRAAPRPVQPTRVIAQDQVHNPAFAVPLPQPEESPDKTIDSTEAQNGEDTGSALTPPDPELARLAAGQQAKRKADELRVKAEEQAERQKTEELATRQKADEQAQRQKADELALRQKTEEQAARQKAEELALRQKAEELAARQQLEEQALKKKAEEQALRQKAEELAARQKAEEQAARRRAEEQAAQKAAEQSAQQAAARPATAPGTAGGSGGGGTTPATAPAGDLASRLREQARGLDLLRGAPPRSIDDSERGRRRVSVTSAEKDISLRMYAESWRQKIERNGGLNYSSVSKDRVRVDPIVVVAIRSDGSVEEVTILRSTGRPDKDEAVRRIVQLYARYSAFPPNIAAKYDIIEIRRVWTFDETLRIVEEVR